MKKASVNQLFTSILAAALAAVLPGSCSCHKETPELPILAWYSIPAEDATVERYEELRDAGFTISYSQIDNLKDALEALDYGEKTGVKVMVYCKELFSDTEGTVQALKDHPAFWGYSLGDEPSLDDFRHFAPVVQKIKSLDSDHVIYLNLFPNFAPQSVLGPSYAEYIHRFIKDVQLPLLSFDNYPVLVSGVRREWWDNLEVVSREAREAGVPLWGFAIATAHHSYPVATTESLRLQMYTNLAYGAQGLQYFTYWCPTPGFWDFHEAPVDEQGNRTATYDIVKAMNAELQARAFVFVGSTVEQVSHTGDVLPPGVRRLEQLPEPLTKLDDGGKGVVVSVLRNGRHRYLMLVNRSLDQTVDLEMAFSRKVRMIGRDGKPERFDGRNGRLTLDKGDCAIFDLKH